MIVVIQCAGSKLANAGSLFTKNGQEVHFVAHPELAPNDGKFYARPDDEVEKGITWRKRLLEINLGEKALPDSLLSACLLYKKSIYKELMNEIGSEKCYILSAGWGLVRSDFKLPSYDITFSKQAKKHLQRKKTDHYQDFSMLPINSKEPIIFFGGKDYQPLFQELSANHLGQRTVVFRSLNEPVISDCKKLRYKTKRMTNWHYEAAKKYLSGDLSGDLDLSCS